VAHWMLHFCALACSGVISWWEPLHSSPLGAVVDGSRDLPRIGRSLHRRSRKVGRVSRTRSILPDSFQGGNVPPFVAKEAGTGIPPHAATARTQINEILLAFRAVIEQVRLAWRDGRRLIRQLTALCATSKPKGRVVQTTSDPAPLVLVPLVVLASTTECEQMELHHLVQSLSAEGYQIAQREHRWTVYTRIPDRRNSVDGRCRTPEQRRSMNPFDPSRCDNVRAEPIAQTATVLIVDDDPATLDTFAQVLRLEGYEVWTALSAEDGMRVVRESGPDAILLDYNMPLANGMEFLRWLRACEGHRDTPVAIVTGDYSLDDRLGTELQQLGARVAFKPLSVAELVDLTSQLFAGLSGMHHEGPPTGADEHPGMHL
jgi:CheY-like chemotaxis protein